jgi:hypothetical protein
MQQFERLLEERTNHLENYFQVRGFDAREVRQHILRRLLEISLDEKSFIFQEVLDTSLPSDTQVR